MKTFLLYLSAVLVTLSTYGQKNATSRIVSLSVQTMMADLKDAPFERPSASKTTLKIISLPMPDGSQRQFYVEANGVLSEDFARVAPELKTYSLKAVDDPLVFGRLTVSPHGIRATIFQGGKVVDIAPLDERAPLLHKSRLSTFEGKAFECGVTGGVPRGGRNGGLRTSAAVSNGATLRTFRIAIVTTGEFYLDHASSVSATQAAVAANVNSLSAIYERELAVKFSLLTPYIYRDTNTDPWVPDADNRLELVAQAIGNNFAANTYDIGHAMHGIGTTGWGGGGVAGLNTLCDNGEISGFSPGLGKGRGWSCMPGSNPVDDLSIFAHEIGHQFSMPHSWNGICTAPPDNQIGEFDAYEIGSGSTIMAYNQVCYQTGSNIDRRDLPANLYFHNISLTRALDHMANNASCGTSTASGNTPPVVNAASCGSSFTLPKGTPFKLIGSGTDADGDAIYYTWEQFDEDGPGSSTQGKFGAAAAADPLAPLFRSYPPTTDATRTFPNITLVAANNYASNFEPLPTVSRTMKFRLTGRDYHAGAGGINYKDALITVSSAGPFTVSAPNSGGTLAAGSSTTVTWNLNGITFLNNVNIKLSTDGGLTFPYTLATNAPAANSTKTVTMPAGVPNTTKARIMVESNDYACFTFFDISDTDFAINSSCNTPATLISPADAATFPAGAAGLNLGLSNNVGTVVTNFTGSITSSDASGNLVGYDNTPAVCATFSNPVNLDSYNFSVSVTGSYTINHGGPFGTVLNLYQAPFTGTNCTNHISSSATRPSGTGGISLNNGLTTTLTAGVSYVLVVSSFSDSQPTLPFNYTISFPTNPSGSNVYNGMILPPNYSYTYIAANTGNSQVVATSITSDFTSLAAGVYEVYGAAYYSGSGPNPTAADPANWVGQTTTSILSGGTCVSLSTNFKPVTVTATGVPSLAMSGSPSMAEGSSGTTTLSFTVTRTGNTANASSVEWAVTGSGANSASAADFGGSLPSGTVDFPVNAISRTISVSVQGDTEIEPNEGFTVTLANPVNANITTSTDNGTILNDDVPTVVSITHPNCINLNGGSIVLNNLPASATWTLTRNPGAVATTGTGNTATVSGLSANTYSFTLTIGGYTSAASADVVLVNDPNPAFQEVVDGIDNNCNGVVDENSGLHFDGTNDYVKSNNITRSANAAMTIESWFKLDAVTGNNRTVLGWVDEATGKGFMIGVNTNGGLRYLEKTVSTAGWGGSNYGGALDLNWHHISLVRDANGTTTRIYLDGSLFTERSSTNDFATTNIYIGQQGGFFEYFQGTVDEVRVWNYAKTLSQIQADMTCTDMGATSGLQLYYDFNNGAPTATNSSRTVTHDFSGNNLTGTLSNFNLTGTTSNYIDGHPFPLWYRDADGDGFGTASDTKRACPQPSGYVAAGGDCNDANAAINPGAKELFDGIDNNCNGAVDEKAGLHFDGTNDYVRSNEINRQANAAMTMEAWFKLDAVSGGNRSIFGWTDDATGKGFMIGVNSGGSLRYLEKTVTGSGWGGFHFGNVLDLNWHHIAMVRDANGTTTRVYVDGIIKGDLGTTNNFVTTNIYVGQQGGFFEYFVGTIDEVKIWNTAKTAAEILAGINCSAPSGTPRLYYDFNQGIPQGTNTSVTQVYDYSGNNFTGTLFNLALTGSTSNFVNGYTGAECTQVTFYPRLNATDLSQTSNWTLNVSGGTGSSPTNFTSANQLFNLTNNASNPAVNSAWTLSGGSSLVLNSINSLKFGPSSRLTIGVGSSADFNGKPVILQSTLTGTAAIGNIAGTLLNATNVTVERYIPAKAARRFSFLSAPPVGGTVRNTWQQQVFVTGAGTGGSPCGSTTGNGTTSTDKYNSNGFDVSGANAATIYYYDGSQVTGSRWTAMLNTSTSLVPGKGYRINVRGPRGTNDANCVDALTNTTPAPPAGVTLSATGIMVSGINMGNVTLALDGVRGDQALLGNPYPSPIDFETFTFDNTHLNTPTYWLYSPLNSAGAGTQYTTYNSSTHLITFRPPDATNYPSDGSKDKYLASGQSFFVEKGSGASVLFKEAHKTTAQTGAFRTTAITDLVRIALKNSDASVRLDEVVVAFANDAGVSRSAATDFDSRSMNEGAPVLVSLKGAARMAIQTRPLNFINDTVQLGVTINALGTYRLDFSQFEQLASAPFIILRDKFLNTDQNIRTVTSYSFNVTSDAGSMGDKRFEIVFKTNSVLPVSYINIAAKLKGAQEVEVNWQVPSEMDIKNYQVERSTDAASFKVRGTIDSRGNSIMAQIYNYTDAPRLVGTSYYRIKISDKSGRINYSPIVKVSTGKEPFSITIHPNPVKNKLSILLQNAEGSYSLRLTTLDGKLLHKLTGTTLNGNTISINTSLLSSGIYIVEVTSGNGNKSIAKLVKE